MLAEAFLKESPGSAIVHDPRLIWNTIDIVNNFNGKPVQSKTGHAFIKESMRAENAVYGGEMSAHHYFRDFSYCDSGMIPWLLVCGLMASKKKPLAQLVKERQTLFPCSGEINRQVPDPEELLEIVQNHFFSEIREIDQIDGISANCGDWRFNLRTSNTEPVVRLNVESYGDAELMKKKTSELLEIIDGG